VGNSEDEVFATLSTPPSTLYRTVGHLATVGGGTTEAECVTNTWAQFAGLATCKWNEDHEAYDTPMR